MQLVKVSLMAAAVCCLWVNGWAPQSMGQDTFSTFPPAGYPLRTLGQVPGLQPGPSNGIAARGGSSALAIPLTQPYVGTSPSLMRPPHGVTPGLDYWSPTTAVWEVQQQLRAMTPSNPGGQDASLEIGDRVPASLPQDYGLANSTIGLDSLAQFRKQLMSPPGPALGQSADNELEQIEKTLDIPFEEFADYEEFRDWLNKQLAEPAGGALSDALAGINANGVPQDQSPEPDEASDSPYGRPPIGYIGLGSSASIPLGQLSLGQDVAYDSARLVEELNFYLLQSRRKRVPPWQQLDKHERRLPPPRSNLGTFLEGERFAPPPGFGNAGRDGLAPASGQWQYWQNLGGYEPPSVQGSRSLPGDY